MGFLAPAALGLSTLLGLIVALHMLRLRREDRAVSSLLLWRALAQDPPASSPWQRLRRTPLLLLQLAALAALILALARPWLSGDTPGGQHLVLLLDRSASMAAREGAGTRLDLAKARLLEAVDAAPEAQLTVVAFDSGMEILMSGSRDPVELRRVLAMVDAQPRVGDAGDALDFAAALTRGEPGSQVLVFSDGVFGLGRPLPAGFAPRLVRVGEARENQGISALSLEGAAAGRPARLYVEAVNPGRLARTRRLRLEQDGRLLDARDLDLPPGGRSGFTVDLPADPGPDGGMLRAALDGEDGLAGDDSAWLVSRPQGGSARVALLGPGNRFLETALGLLPTVGQVLGAAAGDEAELGAVDFAILDRVMPADLPAAPLLLIAPPAGLGEGGPDALEVLPQFLDQPPVRVLDAAHPLVAGGELQDLAIQRALALRLGPAWRPILVTEAGGSVWPLLAEGRVAGRPALVLAFDLTESDLPLRPAFPLFMAAALDQLVPGAVADLPSWAQAGESLGLRFSPRVTGARVIDPAGAQTELDVDLGQAVFGGTRIPGLYRLVAQTVQGPDEEATFAVNFIAPDGLDIRPREAIWASSPAAPGTRPDAPPTGLTPSPPPPPGRRELWELLAAAALVLLLAEWLVDHRRALPPGLLPRLGPLWRRTRLAWAARAGMDRP